MAGMKFASGIRTTSLMFAMRDWFCRLCQFVRDWGMSSSATTSSLLSEVTQRLNSVHEEELEAVNLFLKKLEMFRLRREIGQAVDEAEAAGLMLTVDDSIKEFREQHPYR